MNKAIASHHFFEKILLFSSLGCISLFFLSQFGEVTGHRQPSLFTLRSVLTAILAHNILGFGILYVDRQIKKGHESFLQSRKKAVIFLLTASVFIFLFNYLLWGFSKALMGMPSPLQLKSNGIYALILIWLIELVVISLLQVAEFYRNLERLYKRNKELEHNEIKFRYKALQNQLSPHFLFNSLNTLISEMQYDVNGAISFTRHLADVYRHILECQECRTVTLEAELTFLDSYMYLHNVRLGNCIMIDNQIPEDALEAHLPPLTLQLLGENIIKHNVVNRNHPMTIFMYTEEDNQYLCVKNPICLSKDTPPSGKGFSNLKQRCQLLRGRPLRISLEHQCFIVKVPLYYD